MKAILCAVNSKFIHSSFAAHILYHHIDKTLLNVDVMEYSINDDMDSILRNLYQRGTEIFMFSVYIFNVEFVKKLIGKLKKILPSCIIILGGPEVSFNAEDFLSRNNAADIIIKGEGEYTLNNVLQALCNKDDLDGLFNIVFKRGKEIITTQEELHLIDLNDIIFPYNKENLTLFKNKIIYYESSRGCPFKCAYCMSSIEKQLRYKNLDKVFKELSFFIENKIPIVKFTDRTFNTDALRAQKIWQFIKDNNNHTTFHFEIAADLLTEENIALLIQMPSGFVQLEAGIQSINQQTLQAISRKNDLDKIKLYLKRLAKNTNIHIHTDLIAGLPCESYESFKESFNFVYDLHSDMLQLGFLKILKGSPMMDMLKDGAYVYDETAPYEIIRNKWMSYEDILNLKTIEMTVDKFYNSQSFINILEYVLNKYYTGNAFAFFEQLGIYFQNTSVLYKKLAKPDLYEMLACFLKYKKNYTQIEQALLQFDFLLSNISPLPKSLYLEQITKTQLYDLLMNNLSVVPSCYAELTYKQLIKHINVFEFCMHPLTHEPSQTFIAFWDFKQNKIKNQRYYTVLNKF